MRALTNQIADIFSPNDKPIIIHFQRFSGPMTRDYRALIHY